MSLINDVLDELERNKGEASRYASTLSGKKSGLWRFFYWIVVVVIICGVFWYYNPQLISGQQKKITSFRKQGAAQQAPQPKVALPHVPSQEPPKPQSYSAMIKLQNVVLERKNNQSVLDFVLSGPTSCYVEHESEQQLSITLNNTGVSGNLPVSLENSFIVSLNTKQNKNNIVSTLTLLPGTKIDELQLITQPRSYLHVVLSNSQLSNSSLSKIPAHLTPDEQAEQRYQEIQQLLAQAKTQNALQKLHLFVGDFPDHMQARTLLVSLLIKDGRLQKAQDVLMIGLKKYADYAPFILDFHSAK